MKSKLLWRIAIVAALAMTAGLAAGSPGSAQVTSVPGPTWVQPANYQILSPIANGLTLQVKPVTGQTVTPSGSSGPYLFGLFKVNTDGSLTALYENWANEQHLNGTTWTLAPGSNGLNALQAQPGDWKLQLWARAYMNGTNGPYWSDASIINVHVNWPWSGWSKAPTASGVYVHSVKVTWRVPTLASCQSEVGTSPPRPRAAVWVGMWGTRASMNKGTAQLPQIGTTSECNGVNQQVNTVTWEIAPSGPIQIFLPINTGDTVTASVTFVGFNSAHQALFQPSIKNNVTGVVWNNGNKPVATTAAVTVDQVAGQGGAIVEDEPTAGLAEFNPPSHQLSVTGLTVTAGTGGTTGGYTGYWTLPQWKMSLHGYLLAQNSTLGSGGFTVTWLRKN